MPRLDSIFLHLPFMNVISSKDAMMLYLLRAIRDFINKFTLFFLPIYGVIVSPITCLNLTHLFTQWLLRFYLFIFIVLSYAYSLLFAIKEDNT